MALFKDLLGGGRGWVKKIFMVIKEGGLFKKGEYPLQTMIVFVEDVEINPGLQPEFRQCFSILNLRSITAHQYAKVPILIAYNLVYKFNIICLSEIYLNTETPPNDAKIEIPCYTVICFVLTTLLFIRGKVFVSIVKQLSL